MLVGTQTTRHVAMNERLLRLNRLSTCSSALAARHSVESCAWSQFLLVQTLRQQVRANIQGMGDILRKVDLCGLNDAGARLGCVKAVDAIIDTGASTTVIGSVLAARLGGRLIRGLLRIEGRSVPQKLAGIRLHAPDCETRALLVAVDDTLAERAGGPMIILGHDYQQKVHMGARYRSGGADVACEVGPLSRRRRPSTQAAKRVRRR